MKALSGRLPRIDKESSGGGQWACTDSRAVRGRKIETLEWGLPEGLMYHVYQDSYGKLWVSARSGLFFRNPKEEFFRKIDEGSEFARAFSEDTAGSLWVSDPLVGFRKGGRTKIRAPSPT